MIKRKLAEPRAVPLVSRKPRTKYIAPIDPKTGKKKLGRPKGSQLKKAPLIIQRKTAPGEGKISGAQLTKLISSHFHALNHDHEYLDTLAELHPGIYAQLVAKCLPQAIAVDITAQVLDLGAAMRASQERLNAYQLAHGLKVVEHVASAPEPAENSETGAPEPAENSETGGLAGGAPGSSSGAGVCGPDPDPL